MRASEPTGRGTGIDGFDVCGRAGSGRGGASPARGAGAGGAAACGARTTVCAAGADPEVGLGAAGVTFCAVPGTLRDACAGFDGAVRPGAVGLPPHDGSDRTGRSGGSAPGFGV
jgi:hypothetical protein